VSGPDDRAARSGDLITEAARAEHDFGGWLGDVLARAAARVGSSEALLASRPGSWEAGLVRQLLAGTVGEADEILGDYRDRP
jgi:hypothetical protein